MPGKQPIVIFAKAQVAAFSGGLTDYALMIVLTEIVHIYYPVSIFISGFTGAIVNFSINRNWVFRHHADELSRSRQVMKFACVVVGSIFLKSSGTYLLTHLSKIDYKISRIMIDLVVSYGFNFVLIKNWVFRKTFIVN